MNADSGSLTWSRWPRRASWRKCHLGPGPDGYLLGTGNGERKSPGFWFAWDQSLSPARGPFCCPPGSRVEGRLGQCWRRPQHHTPPLPLPMVSRQPGDCGVAGARVSGRCVGGEGALALPGESGEAAVGAEGNATCSPGPAWPWASSPCGPAWPWASSRCGARPVYSQGCELLQRSTRGQVPRPLNVGTFGPITTRKADLHDIVLTISTQ